MNIIGGFFLMVIGWMPAHEDNYNNSYVDMQLYEDYTQASVSETECNRKGRRMVRKGVISGFECEDLSFGLNPVEDALFGQRVAEVQGHQSQIEDLCNPPEGSTFCSFKRIWRYDRVCN